MLNHTRAVSRPSRLDPFDRESRKEIGILAAAHVVARAARGTSEPGRGAEADTSDQRPPCVCKRVYVRLCVFQTEVMVSLPNPRLSRATTLVAGLLPS